MPSEASSSPWNNQEHMHCVDSCGGGGGGREGERWTCLLKAL